MAAKKSTKIEKAEDKDWQDWYKTLDNKEHESRLAKLGLDKEDIEEWEQHTVFNDLEAEASGALDAPPAKGAKNKKKK